MSTLDKTDRQIVHLLEEDATRSSQSIAKMLSISPATVRRRIGKLTKNGVIRITAIVDPSKAGFYLMAVISLNVDPAVMDRVLTVLRTKKDIRWLAASAGRYNVIMLCRFNSTEDFHLFIQNEVAKLEGIESFETFICLSLEKGRYL